MNSGFAIRGARRAEREQLVDIWLRSVRATHGFLTATDVDGLTEPARAYLTSDEELFVLVDTGDVPVGFMGLEENDVASLFLDPSVHRRGGGRLLIAHAAELRGELTVTVNEQNTGAVAFYEACGFRVECRPELDDDGRPFPVLVLRRPAG